jgi:hypothetical protein
MALAIKMTTDPTKHPKPNATESSRIASLFASSVALVLKFSNENCVRNRFHFQSIFLQNSPASK